MKPASSSLPRRPARRVAPSLGQQPRRHFSVYTVPLKLPALSPTMTTGKIAAWKKKPGDKVNAGDILADITTDKATIDYVSVEEGFLGGILVDAGDNDIPLGTLVAYLVENVEDVGKGTFDAAPAAAAAATPAPTPTPTPTPAAAAPPAAGPSVFTIPLPLPALSPTMTTGKIAEWRKKVGDPVKAGDILADITTDKANIDFISNEDGFLGGILVQAGDRDIPLGEVIGYIVENKEDVGKGQIVAKGGPVAPSPAAAPAAAAAPAKAPTVAVPVVARGKAAGLLSPAVLSAVHTHHLDHTKIQGSGKDGRILKADVLRVLKDGTAKSEGKSAVEETKVASASPLGGVVSGGRLSRRSFTDVQNSQVRKVIAQRLTLSKTTIPHAYTTVQVAMDNLLALRKQLKGLGDVPSVNDFVIRASALALRDVPEVNCIWNDKAGQVQRVGTVDISVAVATDGGLITPIVTNADHKTVASIGAAVKELAGRARAGKLKPQEYQGGSFTISNLGMFGINSFSAVINPPQAAILAVSSSVEKVVPSASGPVKATLMSVSLSCDARVADQQTCGEWLGRFKAYLETPQTMI